MSIKQTNQKISSFFFVLQITWNVDFVISLNIDFKIPRAQSAIKKGGPHRHGGLLILFGICRENIFKILNGLSWHQSYMNDLMVKIRESFKDLKYSKF